MKRFYTDQYRTLTSSRRRSLPLATPLEYEGPPLERYDRRLLSLLPAVQQRLS